jgi:hypothetical protein
MEDLIHLEDRGDGAATIFYQHRRWKRVPREDPDDPAAWHDTSKNPPEVADNKLRRIFEHAYRHQETTEPVRRRPRLELPAKLRQLVFCSAFGFGKVVAIGSDDITVEFGKETRQLVTKDLVTQVHAEVDWHNYWLRGGKRRLKEGERLFIVKGLSEYGEWQLFLDRHDYPRSTADDLITR